MVYRHVMPRPPNMYVHAGSIITKQKNGLTNVITNLLEHKLHARSLILILKNAKQMPITEVGKECVYTYITAAVNRMSIA